MTSHSEKPPIELVFKTVGGLSISLDVYVSDSATKDAPVPIVLWWHGGGLLQGTRKGLKPHQKICATKHNLCFVSADYRLAPQTRLPDILSDCKDAVEFLLSPEFSSAVGSCVDTSKIILSGSSAGGYLALLTGTGIGFKVSGLDPPPPVLGIIGLYSITDIEDPFWTTKQHPVPYFGRMIQKEELEPFLDPSAKKTTSAALDSKRSIFYHYMLQEAILQSLLLEGTGIPPSAFSISANIRSGNFSVPPTYLVHGTIDDKVVPKQSTDVYEAMKAKGFQAKLKLIDGADHSFDFDAGCEMEEMYEFIKDLCK